MIRFVVPSVQVHTVESLRYRIPETQAARIETVTLADLARATDLPASTYVFGGLERTTKEGRDLACQIWNQLAETEGMRLLNNPHRFLSRYDLLTRLRAEGLNKHGAFRARSLTGVRLNFPVFVRGDTDHNANLTELLNTDLEVHRALDRLVRQHHDLDDLIVVEYRHTADEEGIFRKYSACKIASAVFSVHLDYSDYWSVKRYPRNLRVSSEDPLTRRIVDEEYAYVRDNPHASFIREVFDLAEIDYGRVDYSLLNGKPCIWEINTAPSYGRPPHIKRTPMQQQLGELRWPAKKMFNDKFAKALEVIESVGEGPAIGLEIDETLRRRVIAAEIAGLKKKLRSGQVRAFEKLFGRLLPRWRTLRPLRRRLAGILEASVRRYT